MNGKSSMRCMAALLAVGIICSTDLRAEEIEASIASVSMIPTAGAPSEPGMLSGMFRMIGGLLLCLGLFAGGMYIFKKYAPQTNRYTKRRRMELREKLHISSKMTATLIAIDNREFLIATAGDSVTVIPTYSLNTGSFEDSLDAAYRASEVRNG